MGEKIKVSATVLPRTIVHGDRSYLHVDVALNPYLPDSKIPDDYDPNEGLCYYHEICNWPDYHAIFEQDLRFILLLADEDWKHVERIDTLPRAMYYPASDLDCTCIDDITVAELPNKLWSSMFTKKTPVTGWDLDERPFDLVAMLSNEEYIDDVVRALDESIDELLIDPKGNDIAIAHYLTDLRQRASRGIPIVGDPLLTGTIDPRLRRFYEVINNIRDKFAAQLSDLTQEINETDQKKRNLENTAEFHKRLSAYSNHAFLLRRTGWIWTYRLDITDVLETLNDLASDAECLEDAVKGRQLFIRITSNNTENYHAPVALIDNPAGPLKDPFHLSFLQEVKFVYPLTCLQLYKEGNSGPAMITRVNIGKKRDANKSRDAFINIHPKMGYVQIVDGKFRVMASIIDRKQFMQKLEDEFRAIENNSQNANLSGEQNIQNRTLSQAIERERQNMSDHLKNGGGTEYANNGITIAIRQLNKVIQTSVRNNPAVETAVISKITGAELGEGTALVYRHNLVAGYRIDAAALNLLDATAGRFYFGTLCKKEEYYFLKDEGPGFCVQYPKKDCAQIYEGWVGVSAQASNSNRLYIDEELTRWNNWSLVCMRMEDKSYIERPPDDTALLNIATIPPEGSMVPQRFGWRYIFAVRPADICGGGPPPVDTQLDELIGTNRLIDLLKSRLMNSQDKGCFSETYWTVPIVYQRVDSIAGPTIVLGTQLFLELEKKEAEKTDKPRPENIDTIPDWRDERWGEDALTMVIRSYASGNDLVMDVKAPSTLRYLGPAPATVDHVMQHGALDNLLLDSTRNSVPDADLEKLRMELLQLAEKNESTDPALPHFSANQALDYLYDPLARGLQIEVNTDTYQRDLDWSMFGNSSGSAFNYIKKCYWKKDGLTNKPIHHYYGLTLSEKSDQGVASFFDPEKGMLLLRKGCEFSLVVSCIPHTEQDGVALFYNGIVPARKTAMKAIHAVQKPCLTTMKYTQGGYYLPDIDRGTIKLSRLPGQTGVKLSFAYEKFPVLTAEYYLLHMQYIDLVGDKTRPQGYRLEKVQKIILSDILPSCPDGEKNVLFQGLEHSMNSTVYRGANYKIEAVSRFRKFFKPGIKDFSVFGILRKKFADMQNGITDLENPGNYEEFVIRNGWVRLPSTKCPAKIVVDKITPLIDWQYNPGRIRRICNRVRIYFDGEWYSSGAGEQVAIFFMDNYEAFHSGHVTQLYEHDKPESLQNVLSQFGQDPASGLFNPVNIITDNFFVNKKQVLSDIPLRDLQFERPPDHGRNLDDKTVKAALYDIQFESAWHINIRNEELFGKDNVAIVTEGRYYIDVEINPDFLKPHYFPFSAACDGAIPGTFHICTPEIEYRFGERQAR